MLLNEVLALDVGLLGGDLRELRKARGFVNTIRPEQVGKGGFERDLWQWRILLIIGTPGGLFGTEICRSFRVLFFLLTQSEFCYFLNPQ